MKLSQLYANKSFKNISFNDGLNLVLAKVTKKKDITKDSHNLGKTTLIYIIDFMLLKDVDSGHIFAQYKEKFYEYEFFLELILNSGEYLTIKRSINNPTKISFKKQQKKSNLLDESNWDETEIPMRKAKEYLNTQLNFDVLPSWEYRKSLTYFLRTQKDYNDVFQVDKFVHGKHVDWKPFVFDLMGFDGNLLTQKYQIDDEISSISKLISTSTAELAVNSDEVDKINGTIQLKKIEQHDLQFQIDSFNFYNQERELNRELVEEIESRIAELNTVEYNLQYELQKITNSFVNAPATNIKQLQSIYNEVKVYFPDILNKEYSELEDFNNRISSERNKYLTAKSTEIKDNIKKLQKDLLSENQKRDRVLSILTNRDSFKKFKSYQIDLTKVEGEIARLEEKLVSIGFISKLSERTKELKNALDELVKEINSQISTKENLLYTTIRSSFHSIFKHIFNVPAIIFIRQNSNGNIEFKAEVTKKDEIDTTAEGKGNTYLKLLCIAFDLSVLASYHDHSFFRFAYHDGALEGLDNRKKTQFIDLVRQYCLTYNLQYIFSAIQDDIPTPLMAGFSKEEICLTLNDSGEKGTLFEFNF